MLRAVPLLIYMAVIHLLSSIEGEVISPWAPDDRLSHSLAYFAFGWLAMLAIAGWSKELVRGIHFVAGWLLSLFHGMSDEIHQSFVPGRDTSLQDLYFDVLGASAALLLIALLVRGRRRVQ